MSHSWCCHVLMFLLAGRRHHHHHHHHHLLTVVLTITSPVLGRAIRRKERFSSKLIRAIRRVTFRYSFEILYEASYDDLHIKTVKISETHHFLDSSRGCLLFSFVTFRCLARLTFNKYLLNVSKYLLLIRRVLNRMLDQVDSPLPVSSHSVFSFVKPVSR